MLSPGVDIQSESSESALERRDEIPPGVRDSFNLRFQLTCFSRTGRALIILEPPGLQNTTSTQNRPPTTPLPSSMSFDAPKVYSEEMIRFSGEWLGGYPLWYPEPDGGKEVQIGDVGYIFGGRFKRLFNVLEARKADQVQPKGFKPLEYNMKDGIDIRPRYLAPGTHASKTVTVLQGEVKG